LVHHSVAELDFATIALQHIRIERKKERKKEDMLHLPDNSAM